MNEVTLLKKDIKRLVEEYSTLSTKQLSFDKVMTEEQLLQLKENLELELSLLRLKTTDNKTSVSAKKALNNKTNVSTKKALRKTKSSKEYKNELTKKQRLCLKLLNNPHTFFADSKNPLMRFISIFIPKR